MLKAQNKVKKLFKGAVFGVACVLSLSAIPFATLKDAADAAKMTTGGTDTPTISLPSTPSTIKKGETYKIKKATYKNGSSKTADVVLSDTDDSGDGITTSITVKYKGQDQEEALTEITNEEGYTASFTPQSVGTYVITYNVKDGKENYSYNYEVVASVSEASFDFEASEDILPAVYDIALVNESEPKNVYLPLPKVLGGDGNEITVKGEEDAEKSMPVYTKLSDVQEKDTDFVLISITDLEDALVKEDGKVYIKGSSLVENKEGKVYTITYTYYQQFNKNKSFVTSATKEIKVEKGYYKMSDETGAENGFELSTSFANSKPDKASTGVKITLPKVNATTNAKNKPASEKVDVTFDVKVMRKSASGKYDEDVTSSWNKEDNTFTAPQDGDYKFSYTVTDFYHVDGQNDKHQVSNETMTFYINGVKDDVAPEVTIYDASEITKDGEGKFQYTKDEETGKIKYNSAVKKVKSKSVDRNFIIYAIGSNDNKPNGKLELSRVIRDNANRPRITIEGYDEYNLIFNWAKENDGGKTPGQLFLQDNPTIANMMTTEDKQDDEKIKTWLKKHNFLIVTHDHEVDGKKTEEDLIGEGLAYVDNRYDTTVDGKTEKKDYVFSSQTYNVYYIAKDEAGNTSESESVSMYITTNKAYTDLITPTVTFVTSLQDTYLPTETFTFSEPSISDRDENGTGDSRLETFVGYRYLTDGDVEVNVKDKAKEIKFVTNSASVVSGKWYGDENEHKANFIVPEKNSSGDYFVNLNEKPSTATKVEVFVYSTDDYGNIGFFSKVIRIASVVDTKAPAVLGDIETFTEENADVKQGGKIQLPKIVYTDDYVSYMTHSIEVYYINHPAEEGQDTYTLMPSENSYAEMNAMRQRYTLNAGTFTAHKKGDYLVVVTVKDEANNSIASFFKYNVDHADVKEEDIDISNITSETVTLELGKERTLQPPTLKVTDFDDIGFIGYDQNDDAKTANYYEVKAVSAASSHYELKQHSFKATMPGKYEIQYRVFLIQYNVSVKDPSGSESLEVVVGEDKISRLKWTDSTGSKSYYIMVDMNGVVKEIDDQSDTIEPKLIAVAAEDISGDAVDEMTKDETEGETKTVFTTEMLTKTGIKLIPRETDVQKIMVEDSTAPVINVDDSEYKDRSQVEVDGEELTSKGIIISKKFATEESYMGLHPTKSYVEISVKTPSSSGSSTTYTEKIELNKWDEDRSNSTILERVGDKGNYDVKLKLNLNGEYSIKYVAEDYYGNKSELPLTFRVGDVEPPKVIVDKGFINKESNKYIVNEDKLQLDLTKLSFTDGGTELVGEPNENLVIEVKNAAGTVIKPEDGTSDVYPLETIGTYTISIKITDEVGWTTTEEVKITVNAKDSGNNTTVYRTVGTILIVISALILVGVIGYFIYSKIKMDKEVKGTSRKKAKKSKKQ